MDNAKTNNVIELFYKRHPLGDNFGDMTHNILPDFKDAYEMKDFLETQGIIEIWENSSKHKISNRGKEIWEEFKDIELYLKSLQKAQVEKIRIDKIKEKLIIHEYYLKKWQMVTFWPLFIISIGGLSLSIYNSILVRKQKSEIETFQLQLDTLKNKKTQENRKREFNSSQKIDVDSLNR